MPKLSQAARRQQRHGSQARSLSHYIALVADESRRTTEPAAYLNDLIQGLVMARVLGKFDLFEHWQAEAQTLLTEHPAETYRYERDVAEGLRKQAVQPGMTERDKLLLEAHQGLERSLELIEAQFEPNSPAYHAEKGATYGFLARLHVAQNDPERAAQAGLVAQRHLERGRNPYYQLYADLNQVEIMSWLGRREWRLAGRNLATSLRYGNLWPPHHFLRAGCNAVSLLLPAERRQAFWLRYGQLMPTLPPAH
jgi:hypothetical protein